MVRKTESESEWPELANSLTISGHQAYATDHPTCFPANRTKPDHDHDRGQVEQDEHGLHHQDMCVNTSARAGVTNTAIANTAWLTGG